MKYKVVLEWLSQSAVSKSRLRRSILLFFKTFLKPNIYPLHCFQSVHILHEIELEMSSTRPGCLVRAQNNSAIQIFTIDTFLTKPLPRDKTQKKMLRLKLVFRPLSYIIICLQGVRFMVDEEKDMFIHKDQNLLAEITVNKISVFNISGIA